MKALSLKQPWASLLVGGEKLIETRSWKTTYRGPIAIHASKVFNDVELVWTQPFAAALTRLGFNVLSDLPLGVIIGVGSLQGVRPAVDVRNGIDEKEAAFGNYDLGRWAWVFADLCVFKTPVLAFHRTKEGGSRPGGMQGLWTLPDDVVAAIDRQLRG